MTPERHRKIKDLADLNPVATILYREFMSELELQKIEYDALEQELEKLGAELETIQDKYISALAEASGLRNKYEPYGS